MPGVNPRPTADLSILNIACVWWFMSASQAVLAGWMEIPNSAVDKEARTEQNRAWADEETLAALVNEYAGTLYRVSFSVLRNAADAEDAVQEAFLRVLKHRDTLHEVRDRRVWLIRIVWNIVLDRKRRAKTRPETDDVAELARVLSCDGLSAEERAAAAQHHAHVLACVEQLPLKERQVLMLSAFEELNSVEIAEVLGITESSVRSRLFRARNLMAGLLGHERQGPGNREQGTGY
ncbi:MAG: RNA polymerase sigma factor [Terracidiphilus sp.]|jgi:RNA polymerase sigma-70 factor (ECF subfamily)